MRCERWFRLSSPSKSSLTQAQVELIKKKRVEAFSKRLQKRLKDESWLEHLSKGWLQSFF
jgi:hypothetical protein